MASRSVSTWVPLAERRGGRQDVGAILLTVDTHEEKDVCLLELAGLACFMPTTQRQLCLFSCLVHLAAMADPKVPDKKAALIEITKTLTFVQRADPEFAPVLQDLVECSLRVIGSAATS